MPELPEVETTLRGIAPHWLGHCITDITVRQPRLRQPVPSNLQPLLHQPLRRLERRAKYLLATLEHGEQLLIHLGMSGSLRVTGPEAEVKKHDHVIVSLDSGRELRFHDPRRFGLFLPIGCGPAEEHPLLKSLGPEPLGEAFTPAHLQTHFRGRKVAVKLAIMDPKVVVGVGNIYASESLFRAGIRPATPAGRISMTRLRRLVEAIRQVLSESIAQGGTTLRDFVNSSGEPGYFRQRLFVYERGGEPCLQCGTRIRQAVMGQRSTYWCPSCQS